MSPKHRMITMIWCLMTMFATLVMSHGHLIMREIMLHWPTENSWEGRLENALYTQGGLVFIASFVVAAAILVRGYFAKIKDEELARKELAQRENHERAAARRHEAMMESLTAISTGATVPKKSSASGVTPR